MHSSAAMADKSSRRRRSSSILQVYHEPPEPIEQLSDQSALPNLNANWVNAKGTYAPGRVPPRVCLPLQCDEFRVDLTPATPLWQARGRYTSL
jgi:hypothetical protein